MPKGDLTGAAGVGAMCAVFITHGGDFTWEEVTAIGSGITSVAAFGAQMIRQLVAHGTQTPN